MRKILDGLNGFLILIMSMAILFQITAREILHIPTSWSVEASIILFLFVVFLGIPSITRERTHLCVDAIKVYFPAWLKRIVDICCGSAIIAFFCAFAYGAYRNVLDNWDVELPSIAWIRWGYVYLFILLATLINIWYLTTNLVEDIKGTRESA